MAIDYLLNEDGGFFLQEDGVSRLILDDGGTITATAPTSATATLDSIANGLDVYVGPAFIARIPLVRLGWTSSSNGSAFDHYELQRVDENGALTCAYIIADESVNYFNDIEIRHGVATFWQIRSVLRTGDVSAWLTFPTRTITIADKCAVYLVSNYNLHSSLALYDEPGLKYQSSNADNVTFVDIEGRDTPVGFIPMEGSGDIVTRTFTIAFNDTAFATGAVRGGRHPFNQIKKLIEDGRLPSVTLLDGYSDRMFCTAKIAGMTLDQPGNVYHVAVEFHETASRLNPPIVTVVRPDV